MSRLSHRLQTIASLALVVAIWVSLPSCRSARASSQPTIEITTVPQADDGTPDKLEEIAGRVRGALPGERVVVFALSGVWWVQPEKDRPFTTIQADSRWNTTTHPGSVYAALLVDARYRPPLTVNALPDKGGPVLAVAIIKGRAPSSPPPTLQFSGYQWEVRQTASSQDGGKHLNVPAGAWTDENGFLHLRVSKQEEHWVSAEVKLSRSLGFGSYRFVVHELSHLDPAAVFALFTWDELGPPREMDIEISRWGEPQDKNAQYVVQPYIVPANTVRFDAPAGPLTYWMDWEPGRVSFKTIRGSGSNNPSDVVAQHVFTSGVPSAGSERIHMNLYSYGNKRHPLQHEFEVVIEKFEFLP
jgi:hypothetical protein